MTQLRVGSRVKIVINKGLLNRTLDGKRGLVVRLGAFVRVYLEGEGWTETLLRSEVIPL